jgi:nucleoside-diphosphate-sugar epimerase
MREAPISPYAVAKTAAGHLIGMLWRNQGFPGRVARLFLVYGPGQSGARFVPQLVLGALEDKRFPVSAGEQLRDFCHVEDIADGLLAMLACDAANGQCINLASGNPVSIRDLIERVVARVGGGSPQWGRIPYRAGENMALYADVSRARQLFRWQPAIGLDDGLARTIDWYRHQTDA